MNNKKRGGFSPEPTLKNANSEYRVINIDGKRIDFILLLWYLKSGTVCLFVCLFVFCKRSFLSGENNSRAASSLIQTLWSIILTEINTAAQCCFSEQTHQKFTSRRVFIGHIFQSITKKKKNRPVCFFHCSVKCQPIKRTGNNYWKPLWFFFFFQKIKTVETCWIEIFLSSSRWTGTAVHILVAAISAQNHPSVGADTCLF